MHLVLLLAAVSIQSTPGRGKTSFRWCKFLHHSFCSLSFLSHGSGMLAPLKPQTLEQVFQSVIFWKHNLLGGCVNWENREPENMMTSWPTSLMHITFSVMWIVMYYRRNTNNMVYCQAVLMTLMSLLKLLHQTVHMLQHNCDWQSHMVMLYQFCVCLHHCRLACLYSVLSCRTS